MESLSELTVAEARAQERASLLARVAVPEPVAEVTDFSIPGPGGPIAARMYRPALLARPAPTLVWFPGGGWVLGSLDAADLVCRKLANETPCAVVAVEYRQAPEHRFPAAVDDCLAATGWIATMRTGSASTRRGSRSEAPARVGTSPRWWPSSLATRVGRRSPSRCSSTRRPTIVRAATPRTRERSTAPTPIGAGRTTLETLRETTRALPRFARRLSCACRLPSSSRRSTIRCVRKVSSTRRRLRAAGVEVEHECYEAVHGFFSTPGSSARRRGSGARGGCSTPRVR